MGRLPELPAEAVAEYWRLVRDALVAKGMAKSEATTAIKAYRAWMKPAGWTIYNDDPTDTAEAARDYAAWMMEEKGSLGTPPVPRTKTKQSPVPTDIGGANGEKWLRATNVLAIELERPPTSVEVGKLLGLSKSAVESCLPIEGDIRFLPRWAKVALAARSVRRVQPLFESNLRQSDLRHVASVRRATAEAESAAAMGRIADYSRSAAEAARAAYIDAEFVPPLAYIADAADVALQCATNARANAVEAVLRAANLGAEKHGISANIRRDYQHLFAISKRSKWTDSTPVPPAVFGPLWPEGPPADWPELPKPAKLKVTVQVPDYLEDAAVRSKLQKLTTALARLNVAGGGHGLKLVPPIDFTHEQDKGRADVVREEGEKPQGRGHARRGR